MEVFECRTCRGTGKRYQRTYEDNKIIYKPRDCVYCNGTGYVDWIDNVVDNEDYGFFYEGYENLNMPMLKQLYPKLVAKDLVSVQPMSIPRPLPYFKLERSFNENSQRL